MRGDGPAAADRRRPAYVASGRLFDLFATLTAFGENRSCAMGWPITGTSRHAVRTPVRPIGVARGGSRAPGGRFRAPSTGVPTRAPRARVADVLFGYLPDLDRDVRRPLAEAGYGPRVIALPGEGLGWRRSPGRTPPSTGRPAPPGAVTVCARHGSAGARLAGRRSG